MPYSMRSDLCEIEDSRSGVMLLLKLGYKRLQLNVRLNLSGSPDLGEANWCVMRTFRQQMKRAMWQGTETSSQSKKGTDLPVALCVSAEAHPWLPVKLRGLQFWSSVWPWCRRAPEMEQQRHGTLRFRALRNCEKITLKCYRTKYIMNTFKR